MPFPVALNPVSGVRETIISWKSEWSEDYGGSEPAESRPSETSQGATKTSPPRVSGKDCAGCR